MDTTLSIIKCAGVWDKIKHMKVDPSFFDSSTPRTRHISALQRANNREMLGLQALAGPAAARDFSTAAGRYAAAPDWVYDNPLTRASRERNTIPLTLANVAGQALLGKPLAPQMGNVLKPMLANTDAHALPFGSRLDFKDYITHMIGRQYTPNGIR